ncbi:hypothetical protein, partial [Pseudoalteromonas sp. McH1-7]|uniref:hypothetical protein n=1 Tax=Pseudoalteromonas sp. McH1-7 TaxID=2745574 RepID=UPI001C37DA2C
QSLSAELKRSRLLKKAQISGGCLWFCFFGFVGCLWFSFGFLLVLFVFGFLFFFFLLVFFFIDECYEAKVLVMFLADVSLSLWLL